MKHAQQVIGREGAGSYVVIALSVKLKLACGGFAPRHLNRSAFRGYFENRSLTTSN
jgi:hypothetical protein